MNKRHSIVSWLTALCILKEGLPTHSSRVSGFILRPSSGHFSLCHCGYRLSFLVSSGFPKYASKWTGLIMHTIIWWIVQALELLYGFQAPILVASAKWFRLGYIQSFEYDKPNILYQNKKWFHLNKLKRCMHAWNLI